MESWVDWTWDPKKAATNLKKHRVSFNTAARALEDPDALTDPDDHPDGDRFDTICSLAQVAGVTLFVVHTLPSDSNEPGRIISARKATPRERAQYERQAQISGPHQH
ncbi:MAG: BrnT family toxin [Azospirillaceae bacterium]|nr:BrnT family toxin [Azospirillaceae bacterium]